MSNGLFTRHASLVNRQICNGVNHRIRLHCARQITRPEFARADEDAAQARALRPADVGDDVIAHHGTLRRIEVEVAHGQMEEVAGGLAQHDRVLAGRVGQRGRHRAHIQPRAVIGVPVAAHAQRDQLRAVEQVAQGLIEAGVGPVIAQVAEYDVIGLAGVLAHGAEFVQRVGGDEEDAAGLALDQELRGGHGGLKDFGRVGLHAKGLQFARQRGASPAGGVGDEAKRHALRAQAGDDGRAAGDGARVGVKHTVEVEEIG